MKSHSKFDLSVLFYIPNLIGYARFVIVTAAHCYRLSNSTLTVALYTLFAALDGVDGWAARKFGQCSSFGAWLDVIVDNAGRTLMWSNFEWGFLVSNLEWITFTCNHRRGAGWREEMWNDSLTASPSYVKGVMARGFKTPMGFLAIGGLHLLPIWIFGWQNRVLRLPPWAFTLGLSILLAGRALCAMVEVWCIKTHIKCLLMEDNKSKTK